MTADPRAVEIVGAAIGAHFDLSADASTGAWRYICDCGEVLPVDDMNEANELHEEHQGASVLDALFAAGWSLLPPGGETRTEWTAQPALSGTPYIVSDRAGELVPPVYDPGTYGTGERAIRASVKGYLKPARILYRTVHTTPWQEAPSE